ncbi:acyl-CoA thioesterase [Beijerinckia sp. L45]|uniref:acyl-CoA thioesterase n=1 Tax=Beijerinckia sp. L45 TaxID=1641855 RepID=UPI001FEEABF6|nr:hotdog domain-containing protein [Beijerinckia sp. L45]
MSVPSPEPVARMPLLRTLTLPSEGNLNGGIFGGWVMAQMDLAAGLLGMRRAAGPCTTVAVENFRFLKPLRVGEEFSIYGTVEGVGRTSLRLRLEGFAAAPRDGIEHQVVDALFIVVSLDDEGAPRPVPAKAPTAQTIG